jgi:hypothetical protein
MLAAMNCLRQRTTVSCNWARSGLDTDFDPPIL